MVYAHVGGRAADIARAEDARLRIAVEVHSDWGTFEWILTDAFDLGYRVGVVANSDGHKGAPGACYPGASEFDSGLTCFLTDELTRNWVFDALRHRHHYATTGFRLHLDVTADLGRGGLVYPRDPRLGAVVPVSASTAMMGDIVSTDATSVPLRVAVQSHGAIERVEVLNGSDLVATRRPFAGTALGHRVRVLFSGRRISWAQPANPLARRVACDRC